MDRRRFLLAAGALPAALRAQDADLIRATWRARWIGAPGMQPEAYGVYHFRRTFELAAKPARFIVHVSGDNRYQLFANGKRVAWGPARGDLFHWRFETVDLAPYLDAGRNVLAAVVWNCGELAPEAQITLQTGFVLQGDGVETGPAWKCVRNEAYAPIETTSATVRGYYVAGPGDRVNAAAYPWGWEQRDFDDSAWKAASVIGPAAGREARDVHSRWMLVPRNIPAMEERPERVTKIRRGAAGFPIRVDANAVVGVLLDNEVLTTAYPELAIRGGKDASIRIGYAESLFEPNTPTQRGLVKGNRNEVEGKQFIGSHDEFVADGAARVFRPLWWRTYRYINLTIETKAEPLTIESLNATAVGYPFERRAKFDADAPDLNRILDVGWRTARLCAHETYMDCPYYEQLQYVGDTRVQCLVSLFNSGDARLMRNAIELIDNSRQSEGATMSRYPTRLEQFIPDFSLWWIAMVHDYWRYVDEPGFVRRMLPGVRAVLSFFEGYQKPNGSLGSLPWWRYFDWVPSWPNGDAPQDADGGSAIFDMHLMMAYRWAADLDTSPMGAVYRERERQLRATVQSLYWDDSRNLYADTASKKSYSQHANTLAVLGDVITGPPARDLLLHALADKSLAEPGLFFQFYVHQALAKVGEGDSYLDRLGEWRDMLARGLTTFAEMVDRPGGSSRSDCHAWSASPNIEIFRTVLGVDSAAPGFRKVVVRPHLGKLSRASGTVPHPKGLIEVNLDRDRATIVLPPGTTGVLEWRGVTFDLGPGANSFRV
jgi:alpha-L-rhamnosidase